ncbi:MAG: hypothetical protein AAGF77_06500 [Bacteroidota bacterium]
MKKLIFGLTIFLGYCCSDGDLEIETIDFDSVGIQQCGSVTTDTRILFKINGDEALVLTLQAGVLKNEVSTETIQSTVPGQSEITYRIFDGTVNSGYFCDDIPPVAPVVTEEITAEDGLVLINTVATEDSSFEHTIQLQGISLVNNQGERITDLTINDFGSVVTTSSTED